MGGWMNSQWAGTSLKSTAEGSVAPSWQAARDKGMRHGTSNGSACAVTMSPSGHKYSYQLLLPTTALYQDLCQPAVMLSSLSLSFTHTHTHGCLTHTTLLLKSLKYTISTHPEAFNTQIYFHLPFLPLNHSTSESESRDLPSLSQGFTNNSFALGCKFKKVRFKHRYCSVNSTFIA